MNESAFPHVAAPAEDKPAQESGLTSAEAQEEKERFYAMLLADALRSIDAMGGSASMISAKFGVGTSEFKQNLNVLEQRIGDLETQGIQIFNQSHYLDEFIHGSPGDYETKFAIFFKGLLESGKIKTLYVLPGSASARGVIAEVNIAHEVGVPVVQL